MQGEQKTLRSELERLRGQLRWAQHATSLRAAHVQRAEEARASRLPQTELQVQRSAELDGQGAPDVAWRIDGRAAQRAPHAQPSKVHGPPAAQVLGSAGERFLEALERARERTSQREVRNAASEEIRARAQALQAQFALDEGAGHLQHDD